MKGGWTETSIFGIGGPVHEFSVIVSYCFFLTFNFDKSIDIFNYNIDWISKLNTLKNLNDYNKKPNYNVMFQNSEITIKQILINLLIGVSIPDLSSENKSVCMCKYKNDFEKECFYLPDESINFSLKQEQELKHFQKLTETYVASMNHNGKLSIQHFMISSEEYYDLKNGKIQLDTIYNKIKDCIINRLKLAQYWYKNNYKNAAWRYIGHILHTIQDSFSKFHCNRNESTLNIDKIFCFGEIDENYLFTLEKNDLIHYINMQYWQFIHLLKDIPINVISSKFINLYSLYNNSDINLIQPNNKERDKLYDYYMIISSVFIHIIHKYYFIETSFNVEIINKYFNLLINPNLTETDDIYSEKYINDLINKIN
jgi:hypothetical protein